MAQGTENSGDARPRALPPRLIEVLRANVELLTLFQGQVHQFDELLAQIPDEQFAQLISQSPSWFKYYCIPFQQLPFALLKTTKNVPLKNEVEQALKLPNALDFFITETKAVISRI